MKKEEPKVAAPQPPPKSIKKEKKKDNDALLMDINSLFSQPDKIIRPDKPSTSKNIGPGSGGGFVALTTQDNSKLPGTISIQQTPNTSTKPALAPDQDKQLDLIDSIVSKELDLPDSTLLDTLGDSLPDDFLAELAQNKELQAIIDNSFDAAPNQVESMLQSPSEPLTNSSESGNSRIIVRADGRIITLPPIEVPTTRAKKRKVDDVEVEKPKKVEKAKKPMKKKKKEEEELSTPKASNEPLASATTTSSSGRKRGVNLAVLAVLNNDAEDETEEEEEEEESDPDDDPNRLWCICKTPHGGRFMIACDACEEWFHGKCVNVTKAMGKKMEESGKQWWCPSCRDEKKNKEKVEEKEETSEPKKLCIVCKKPAREDTIYCSDPCILKHAQMATKNPEEKEPKAKEVPKKFMKNKNNRVFVYEKATGKILSGDKAPKVENLKQWLKENPTFQVRFFKNF